VAFLHLDVSLLTTGSHFFASARMKASKSAGELPAGVAPIFSSAVSTTGSFNAAPGRFSITGSWPQVFDSDWPSVRAKTSTAPPAAQGTGMRTGLVGNDWAWAATAVSESAAMAMRPRKGLVENAHAKRLPPTRIIC
jgi:hypothetical protein